jgi:hypothetical protein
LLLPCVCPVAVWRPRNAKTRQWRGRQQPTDAWHPHHTGVVAAGMTSDSPTGRSTSVTGIVMRCCESDRPLPRFSVPQRHSVARQARLFFAGRAMLLAIQQSGWPTTTLLYFLSSIGATAAKRGPYKTGDDDGDGESYGVVRPQQSDGAAINGSRSTH